MDIPYGRLGFHDTLTIQLKDILEYTMGSRMGWTQVKGCGFLFNGTFREPYVVVVCHFK
jgi:hypothetical protein